MQGQLFHVWRDTWSSLWVPLARKASQLGHADLFCELYPDLNQALKAPKSIARLAEIAGDISEARREFRKVKATDLLSERELVAFIEGCYETLDDLGGDPLANSYFVLLECFLERFGLRYDLRRPCSLSPTLQGVFASLVCELQTYTGQDAHLDSLMSEFEDSVRDLKYGCTDGRIKTCIGKQIMLLEAIGGSAPGVTGVTLGDMCDQVGSWPHAAIKESLKKLYGFASDYPGIRHGRNTRGVLRAIEMRDMIVMSILLAGFTPYLTDQVNAEVVYRGR
jgi:hypothetical protein